jgi:hypothetical protein
MTAKRKRGSGRHGKGHSAKVREAKTLRCGKANKRRTLWTAPREPQSDDNPDSGVIPEG